MIRIIAAIALLVIAGAAFARGGDLDLHFGDNGYVAFLASVNPPQAVLVAAPDAKVLVVESQYPGVIYVTRLLHDGRADASFGRNGLATIPHGASITHGALDPAGRLLLFGVSYPPAPARWVFARLDPNGFPDPAFGSGGWAVFAPTGPEGGHAAGLRVLGDGRIAAVGFPIDFIFINGLQTGTMTAFRLLSDGRPDPDYGTAGVVARALDVQWSGGAPPVRLLEDGSIDAIHFSYGGHPGDSILAVSGRLLPSGRADASPEANRTLDLGPFNNEAMPGFFFMPDGTSLTTSWSNALGTAAPSLRLTRLLPDMTIDRTFGTNGVATLSANIPAGIDRLPDGGYLLAFLDYNGFPVMKLTSHGLPDPAFGSNGTVRLRTPLASPDMTGPCCRVSSPDGFATFMSADFIRGMDGVATSKYQPFILRMQAVGDIVEFRNSTLDHYFLTYDGDEARGIEAGAAGPGWSRTGGAFKPGGTTAVCRFYGTPGIGPNSHFFTASMDECELVKKDRGWTYEGLGFYTTPPVNGQCAAALVPVHRLYNNRAAKNDSGHRFVTDASLVAPMVAQGWVHEGIVFCARP